MEVSKGVIIWMVVYVYGCGVPTTSNRYPGKPVQASGTHDYQAMVEYSIQAELLGMQGEIQNRDLRLQNTELYQFYLLIADYLTLSFLRKGLLKKSRFLRHYIPLNDAKCVFRSLRAI